MPPKARPVFDEASVNGVTIAEADILAEAQNHPAANPGEAVQAAARALVIRELLIQEARRLQIGDVDLDEEDGRTETPDDARIRVLMEREVPAPSASEEECRRFFEHNRAKFRSAPLYEVRHILLAAHEDDRGARDAARKTAQGLCEALNADPSGFANAAAEYSACMSSGEGGRLGQVSRGETVAEFEAALEEMAEGEISKAPVATRFGFHVIALDRAIPGKDLPFDHVHERISAWLEAASWSRAVSQYIGILASNATISGVSFEQTEGPLVQ
ncbi:peptidylprolyl isomerase [uncultured Roseibium sp.]|uniref:peptidylprolyl isomerase n=1 Tax=uncultured Roseibium sp. TaxID=1936171 RepID=UPI0032176D6A